jgi:hypothetical protein
MPLQPARNENVGASSRKIVQVEKGKASRNSLNGVVAAWFFSSALTRNYAKDIKQANSCNPVKTNREKT